jgi:hypothetical protein
LTPIPCFFQAKTTGASGAPSDPTHGHNLLLDPKESWSAMCRSSDNNPAPPTRIPIASAACRPPCCPTERRGAGLGTGSCVGPPSLSPRRSKEVVPTPDQLDADASMTLDDVIVASPRRGRQRPAHCAAAADAAATGKLGKRR